MQYLLLIGIFEAFFLTVLIISKKGKQLHDYILSGYLFIMGVTVFFSFLDYYNRTHNYRYPALLDVNIPFLFLHGPLTWFYIKSLTDQHFRFKPIYFLHFLPFVAVFIEHSINIFSLPETVKIYIDKTELFKSWIIYPIIVDAVAIVTLGYLIWGWILIRKYNRYIQNYFSETNQINLRWLRILLISTVICYALNDFTYILDFFFHFAPYKVLQLASFMIASIFILVLGFFGHSQGNIFTAYQVDIDLKKSIIPSNDEKIKKEDEHFVNALITYMKENKPFLNPELTIAALSRELNVSPYYLSDILNNKLNLNFYDFINHYRVEEFKMKLTNPENERLTFSGIASDCGFNSKATFYRVFKKSTGSSPNEYYKAISRN